MGVYHIVYSPELKEICLYFDGGCNFSCHGCITRYYPQDCHLDELPRDTKKKRLSQREVISFLKSLSFRRVIFLGLEPALDPDFLLLAKILKERFSTYNIVLTNGWEYIDDKAIDEVCVSIKAYSKTIFKEFTGKDNPEKVLENFKKYAENCSIKLRAESVFIPGYIDNEEIEKIARFIASIDSTIPYRIDAYIPFGGKDKFRKPTKEEMERANTIAHRYLKKVSILHKGIKVRDKVKRVY
ncbi:MAG: radical SAM domain-containing protein [bacterium]|nr:MAG: radical SAM domain-containing protein [bacterium]